MFNLIIPEIYLRNLDIKEKNVYILDHIVWHRLEKPMKKWDSLRWEPRWVSNLGCIKGCLDYLNRPVSHSWLYGATGHAFVLNICGDLCPSGPTDWDTSMFRKLGKNVGYVLEGVSGWRGKEDLAQLQEEAWEFTKNALDKAIAHFAIVSQNLDAVKQAYPFDPELNMDPILLTERSQSAALALKRAKNAEATGLEVLSDIVDHLKK